MGSLLTSPSQTPGSCGFHRQARFDFRYLETLLAVQDRTIEAVNLAENSTEDMLSDLTSIIYSFCAKLYGQRRAKRKTEALVAQIKEETAPMQLVEQHLIRTSDPRFAIINAAAFASKNLYNQTIYQILQAYLHEGKYLPYAEVFHRVKHMDCYKSLPAKVANSILILIHKNWVSFFHFLRAYQLDPSTFVGRPRIPGYKDKERGRNILIYDTQALGKRHFKQTGKLVPSGLPIEIETCLTEWWHLDQVRIVPAPSGYMIEVVYEQPEEQADVTQEWAAALDPGVDTLAALTSNKPAFQPLLVNGRPLKSENQFYNKQRAHLQSLLPENQQTSHRLTAITTRERLSAYGKPSHYWLSGRRGNQYVGPGEKCALEARGEHGKEEQSALCSVASCALS